MRGREAVGHWQELARSGRTAEVVQDLLDTHYDPTYLQSMQRNFTQYPQSKALQARDHSHEAMQELALEILRAAG